MKKLLSGVSALALGLVAASGAWANPKNTFSDHNTQTVHSTAIAVHGAAYSESFNSNLEAVSVQTLDPEKKKWQSALRSAVRSTWT